VELVAVTDWLWCLRTPVVQAYAVRDGDGFRLIDTATAGLDGAILDALGSIAGCSADEVQLKEILLTHGHDDHTGSAAALAARTGARVLGPVRDAAVIEGVSAAPAPRLRDWEVPLYERSLGLVPPAPPVRLDARVDDGTALDWERPARVVAAPGHTVGSIAVHFARARVLVAGDAIASHEGMPMVGVFDVDVPRATETFRTLAELDVDVACFGHGAPLVGDAGTRLRQAAAAL
jgi:glyoxylase-like metal-dependent hydrolase (beta-lactamase superfamily II)